MARLLLCLVCPNSLPRLRRLMRQPGTAAGPKGKHRVKFPIHPFHAGKAKQRRQRKRPRLRIGKRQENPSGSGRYSARPRQPPGPAGVPHSPVGASSQCQPSGDADRQASPRKGQLRPGACWRPGPCRRSSSRERVRLSFSKPSSGRKVPSRARPPRPAEVTFIEPLSVLGQLCRAPRPAAALLDGQPALSVRPVKTAPTSAPPSPPFPSILCGAGVKCAVKRLTGARTPAILCAT